MFLLLTGSWIFFSFIWCLYSFSNFWTQMFLLMWRLRKFCFLLQRVCSYFWMESLTTVRLITWSFIQTSYSLIQISSFSSKQKLVWCWTSDFLWFCLQSLQKLKSFKDVSSFHKHCDVIVTFYKLLWNIVYSSLRLFSFLSVSCFMFCFT